MSGAASYHFGKIAGAFHRALLLPILAAVWLAGCGHAFAASSLSWTNLTILGVTNDATYLFTPTPLPGTSPGGLATGGSVAVPTTNGVGTVSILGGRYTVRISGREAFVVWVPQSGSYALQQLYRDANGGVVAADAPFLPTVGGELTGNLRFSGVLSGGVIPPHLTTGQRDALNTVSNGMLIFNVTLNTNQVRGPGGWTSFPGGTDASVFAQLSTVTSIVNTASAATLQSATNYTDGIVGLYTLLSTFESATNTLTGLINSAGVSAETATNIARSVVSQSNLVNQSQLSTATGAVYAAIPDTSNLATKSALEATNAALVALIDLETAPFITAATATNISAYQALIVSNGLSLQIPSLTPYATTANLNSASNALQTQITSIESAGGISGATATNIFSGLATASNFATTATLNTASNVLDGKITTASNAVAALIPSLTGYATTANLNTASNALVAQIESGSGISAATATNIAAYQSLIVSNGVMLQIPSISGLITMTPVTVTSNALQTQIDAIDGISLADATNAARGVLIQSNLVNQTQLIDATNGLARTSITNNFATMAYAQSLTNPLASIYYAQGISNWVTTQIQATNGLASTNWVALYNYDAQTNGVLPRWAAETLTLDSEFGITLYSTDGGVTARGDFLNFIAHGVGGGVNVGGVLRVTNIATLQSNLTVGGVVSGNGSGLTNVNWPGPGISNVVAGDGILLSTNTGVLVIEATGSGGSTNGITGTQATNIFTGLAIVSNWVATSTFNTSTSAIVGLVDARTTALSNYVAATAVTNRTSNRFQLLTNNGVLTISEGANVTITPQGGTNLQIAASLSGGAASLADITNTVNALSVLAQSGDGTSNTFTAPTLINYPHVSTNTYVLSSILGKGDADLAIGSTDYGTLGDVGPQIQEILDQATNGAIQVVFDGGYSVGQAMVVRGETELHGIAGGGMILRSNANNSLLKNASWGLNTTYDTNISLTGTLVLNEGSRVGSTTNWLQTHSSTNTHWHCVVSFHGVEGFRVGEGVQIIGQRTFGGILGRSLNAIISGTVDAGGSPSANQDGWKLIGPSTNNIFENVTASVGDDAISIMGNDLEPGSTNTAGTGVGIIGELGWNGGPIYGTRVRNLFLKFPTFYGIRIGSKAEYVGQVDIDGVFGQTRSHAIHIDNYTEDPAQFNGPDGIGNLGTVSIRNVQARVYDMSYYSGTIWINASGESLSIKDSHSDYANPNRLTPYALLNTNSVWKQVEIRGLNLTSIDANQSHVTPGQVGGLDDALLLAGSYGQLYIGNNRFLKTTNFGGRPINLAADVGQLITEGNTAYGYDRMFNPVDENQDNVVTNSVYENNLVYPGYFQATTATNTSYGVYDYPAGSTVVAVERDLGTDVNDGTVGSDWLIHGNYGSEATIALAGRGQNIVPWSSANRRRNYYFVVTVSANPSTSIFAGVGLKDSDTADRTIASITASAAPIGSNQWYRSELDTITQGEGVRLIGRVQRKSDGYWLQSNYVWSAAKVAVIDTVATGTNVWRSPVSTIGFGFQATSATNGWLTSSNTTWTPKVSEVDSVPNLSGPRINIGGGAASEAAYVATAESVVLKGATGDRSSIYMESPTNNVGVVLQAVGSTAIGPLGAGYVGSTALTPFRFLVGANYVMELDTNAVPNTSKLRIVGAGNQLELVDRNASVGTNSFFMSDAGIYSVHTPSNTTNLFLGATNGNATFLGNVTSSTGQFIGNGGGLTNYHQTNLVTGLQSWTAVPTSISLQSGMVPNPILAQTNASFTVSSWVPISGRPSNAQLVVSNSSGGNITATLTGTGRFMGTSTNSLVIGSGKVGVIYVESYTGAMTNIMGTVVQQ